MPLDLGETFAQPAPLKRGPGAGRSAQKCLDYLPTDPEAWFDWLLAQPQDTVLSLIVFATAQCADAVQGRSGGDDAAAPLARALSRDMADWWAPTPENYLDLVPKVKLIEAVTETASGQVAAAMVKLKKDGGIAHAHQHVAGHRWLPAPLRSPPAAEDSTDKVDQTEDADAQLVAVRVAEVDVQEVEEVQAA